MHSVYCTLFVAHCTLQTTYQVRYRALAINMDEREIPDFLSAWLDVVVTRLQDELRASLVP